MKVNDVVDHFRASPGYWFVPKAFGFGATPVTWQGWALTLGCAALLILDIRFLPGTVEKILVGAALLTAFTVICVRTTEGGWRWHWGVRK